MLRGLWVPVVTPFDARGRFDAARMRALLHALAETPLAGFIVLGSTGEAYLLDEKERSAVLRAARRALPRHPIVAGTGAESTALAVERTKRAAEEGADGALVLAPAFYRRALSREALERHYAAMTGAVRVPVFLYQFPQANGFAFEPGAVKGLRTRAGVSGIKDSLGEPSSIRRFLREGGPGFSVAVGSAARLLPALQAGAHGAVLAMANVAPRLCAAVIEAHHAGRSMEAARFQRLLDRLAAVVGPLGPVGCKAALALAGLDAGLPRPPLEPPSRAQRAAMRRVLRSVAEEIRA